jgi:hypothetical protein
MLSFSIGMPSRFAEWCDAVMLQLLQSSGPAEAVWASTQEEFVNAVIGARSLFVLVKSRFLGRLQRPLASARLPFIVAVDDPRRALADLVIDQGLDILEATRAVASSCAAIIGCAAMPDALVLHAEADGIDPIAAAKSIAHHLGLEGGADIAGIVEDIAGAGILPNRERHADWWGGLDPIQRSVVAAALEPYGSQLAGGELGPITWERDLFFINDNLPQERLVASRPVDITGAARILIYGPYIVLPPGSWSATIALGFSREAAEISYVVDLVAGNQLGHTRIEPAGRREMEVDLNFTIDEPLDEPIVLRLSSERAAFDGRVALGHVVVSTGGRMRPETHNYFTAAFGDL